MENLRLRQIFCSPDALRGVRKILTGARHGNTLLDHASSAWKLRHLPVRVIVNYPVMVLKSQFLSHIAAAFLDDLDIDPEYVTRVVLESLAKHVSGGEIESIKRSLPEEIRDLWP